MDSSNEVTEFLANALALDDAEREHLSDLARAAGPIAPPPRRSRQRGIRPEVQRILDALGAPAIARAADGDYVAANALGHALYSPLFDSPAQAANSAHDRALTVLVGELSTRSEVFRKLWAAHNVRFHRTGPAGRPRRAGPARYPPSPSPRPS